MRKIKLRKFLIILLILVLPVPVYADYGAIEIDGYYDDWEDKPHTEVYEGKNPPADKINYVSLFRDEFNAYVHIEYARINNQSIINMRVNLYTNLGNARYTLVPDLDLDMFDSDNETDSDNTESISPDADLNDSNLTDGTEGDADNENSKDNGNNSNNNGSDSDSNNTNDDKDSSLDSNKKDTNTDESQESNQILSGKAEEILIAVNDTDETTNNGQDKKDSTTVDSASDQGNSSDITDSTESPGNNTETTDTNTNTDQSNENDETNQDTIIDPLDLFDPDAIIDLEDFLDSLDSNNTDPDDEWNPLDSNNENDWGSEGDPFDSDNNTDQDNQDEQEDQLDPESDWNFHHPGYYGTWSFTVYQGHDAVGYGYFTRSEGEPDEAEFYIPLDTITDEVDGITEISMTIKKLGKQSIVCVGASTEPYIGVAVSAAIVLLSLAGYTYKKQRPLILKRK